MVAGGCGASRRRSRQRPATWTYARIEIGPARPGPFMSFIWIRHRPKFWPLCPHQDRRVGQILACLCPHTDRTYTGICRGPVAPGRLPAPKLCRELFSQIHIFVALVRSSPFPCLECEISLFGSRRALRSRTRTLLASLMPNGSLPSQPMLSTMLFMPP